ncbi:MAG: hypothetical protein EP330_28200 [Deltaproteobacteria bacterium]|nr:MAG: hypothetical protein EP330_28200 [Deltaproteobacteria bacterium]
MIELSRIAADGGPSMPALYAVTVAAVLLALSLGALTIAGKRVPLGAWLAGPMVMLAIGWLGSANSAQEALATLASDAENPNAAMAQAAALARYPRIAAYGLAVPVLTLIAWVGALTSLATGGPKREWTGAHAAITLLLGASAAAAPFALPLLRGGAFVDYLGPSPYLLALLTLGVAPAIAAAAAHTSRARVDAPRLAAARGLTVLAGIGAVGLAGLALADMAGTIAVQATAATAETRALTWTNARAIERLMIESTGAALLALAIAGAASILPVGGHLNDRRSMLGGVSALLLLGGLGALAAERTISAPLHQRADDTREVMAWTDKVRGLPTITKASTRRPEGECLVRRRGSEWVAVQRWPMWPSEDCGPEEAPLLLPLRGNAVVVALTGDTAIGAVLNTQWFVGKGKVSILAQPEQFPSAEQLALVGAPDLAYVAPWDAAGPDDDAAVAELGPEGLLTDVDGWAYLAADPRMNVQDLLDGCLEKQCILTPSR